MFGGGMAAPSLADIAAVVGNNGNNGNCDSFGGNNAWWILIILFALWGNWGNDGYGNRGNGGNNCCCGSNGGGGGTVVYETGANLQRGFDTSQIITKLDGLNNGICSLGYDQLNQMNGINTNIMQGVNALSTQLANCCCENRQGQADIKYAMATDTCAITTAINQAAQNIMQNDNANYRQLHDENVALQMQQMRDQINEKDSLIQSLNLAKSQANQNNYIDGRIENLYNRLSPCPSPAYVVPNPNCCYQPNFWNNSPYNNGNCCNNQNRCCA